MNRAPGLVPARSTHRPQITWFHVRPTTRQAVAPQAISGNSCVSLAGRSVAVPVGPLGPTPRTRMFAPPSHHVVRNVFDEATHALPPRLPWSATHTTGPSEAAVPSVAVPPAPGVTGRAQRVAPLV